MRLITSFAALGGGIALVADSALAIRVTPGSPCEKYCGNVLDNTVSTDMTCNERAYSTSSNGIVFEGCTMCQLSSPFSARRQTDTQWMLYNLRYAVSYCLFGFPDNQNAGSSPCITGPACEPLKAAITFNALAQNTSAYDYCAGWKREQVPKCTACLRAGSNSKYLSNFLNILDAGCQQQPIPGRTLAVEGDPFSEAIVNATDTVPTPSLTPDALANSTFSLGAKVGIAIGGVFLFLATLGFCIVWNGKRRRRRFLRRLAATTAATAESPSTSHGGAGGHKGWPSTSTTSRPDMHETPLSQRPLRSAWDDSPMSATNTERTYSYPRHFSPYSSQYNSPVSAADGGAASMMPWPPSAATPASDRLVSPINGHLISPIVSPVVGPEAGKMHEIGLALGGGGGHWDQHHGFPADVKGKERTEAYEMHSVDSSDSGGAPRMPAQPEPPVLHHPGYGRQGGSPPRRYATLTEADARRGFAL